VNRKDLPAQQGWAAFTNDVRRILTGTAKPREANGDWLTAFRNTGTTLKDLSHDGTLTRGIRAVTAHHILFHWNRLGLSLNPKA
jgi:thiopeptide-type bacteriocin biosynthesis protein